MRVSGRLGKGERKLVDVNEVSWSFITGLAKSIKIQVK